MNKTKAEHSFRMVWENDIPVYAGVEFELDWKDIPWKKLEKRVYKVQKRRNIRLKSWGGKARKIRATLF